jgi:hypothetical protein
MRAIELRDRVLGEGGGLNRAALGVVGLWSVVLLLSVLGPGARGLTLIVRAGRGSTGPVLRRETVQAIDPGVLAPRLDLPKRFVTLQWSGFWFVPQGGLCDLQIRGAADASLSIDGVRVLHRDEDDREARVRGQELLTPGFHAIEVEYQQRAEPPFLRVSWAPEGQGLRPISPDSLFRERLLPRDAAVARFLERTSTLLRAAALLAAGVIVFGWARAESSRLVLAWALPLLVVAYAAALRFEFVTGRTWADEAPALAVEAQHAVASLHPPWILERPAIPYDGDPWNYIRLGRAMVHFYDASIREPVFVWATKCFLAVLGGQDVAVAFASATFSVLLVFATYLLGEAAFSRSVGLIAALALAVEHNVVELAAQGWRDDAFAFFVVLSTFAHVRLTKKPSFAGAVFAGLAGGGACLTRITSLSFLVPAWAYLLAVLPVRPFTRRLELVAGSAALSLACLAPYLATCAIVFHDPFYSINVHTAYYRGAEQIPIDKPMSAFQYLFGRGRPFEVADTFLLGVTNIPFEQRWTGFDYWRPGLGQWLCVLSLLGLSAFPFMAEGRLLLLILVTSLAPFAFTWNVGGGGGWRFRLHAYAFYLLAAAVALVGGARLMRAALLRERVGLSGRKILWRVALGVLALAVAGGGLVGLAYLRIKEEIGEGSGSIEVGAPRNRLLVGSGWSPCVRLGNVPVRLSGLRSTLFLPLHGGLAYSLHIRMDPFPADSDREQAVGVFLNGTPVGNVVLVPSTGRIGSYSFRLPPGAVREGRNELAFRARHSTWVLAAPLGGAWGEWNVAFAVWLVRIDSERTVPRPFEDPGGAPAAPSPFDVRTPGA